MMGVQPKEVLLKIGGGGRQLRIALSLFAGQSMEMPRRRDVVITANAKREEKKGAQKIGGMTMIGIVRRKNAIPPEKAEIK